MRRRLIVLLALLILLPVGALAYFARKTAGDRQAVAANQFRTLLDDRLRELSTSIASATLQLERELSAALAVTDPSSQTLREVRRKSSLVSEVFLLDPEGALIFPPKDATRSEEEAEFLRRTAPIWTREAILYQPPQQEAQADLQDRARNAKGYGDSLIDLARRSERGWIAWHWREGLHFLFWQKLPDGKVVGAEVERIVLLSRIVGSLPAGDLLEGRVLIADSRGDPLYQWGPFEPKKGTPPTAGLVLDHPLDAWRLEYYASPAQRAAFLDPAQGLELLYGLGAVALALLLLGLYLYRELMRDLREASQRVTFVTQVSHELKTPLANIRLYAELLENEIEEDTKASSRLKVIVSESERLTRLIENILTFAKHRRGQLRLEPRPFALDELVRRVLSHFAPAFDTKQIDASFAGASHKRVLADPDAVEQILANLLSNVEKYAAGGKRVEIAVAEENGVARVIVADDGPGVPRDHRERIFEPFHRVSDRLTDGVTGTGIGLTIARELARSSGGDLVLSDSDRGARFVLTLPVMEGE
jgi:signal transduction histidine kinase